MKRKPVVLSYFSQSETLGQEYLQFLEDEYSSIADAWEQYKFQEDRYFEVDFPARGSAKGDKVAKDILRYKENIVIFHFSGHADSGRLFFRDGVSNPRGIAGLLSAAANLKLVFLNGCATHDQVKLLFDNNIKIVIATKGKVNDGIAKELSHTFYLALSNRDYTIGSAFKYAMNELIRKYPSFSSVSATPIVWRGLVTEADDEKDRWELFVKDEYEDELDRQKWWKFGLYKPTLKDIPTGDSFWDHALSFLILIIGLLGIAIMVHAVFNEKGHELVWVGLAAVFLAYFGIKNKLTCKTVEMNPGVNDEKVAQKLKNFFPNLS